MKILDDAPLAAYCTWRTGGHADRLYLPTTMAEAQQAYRQCLEAGQTPIVIGGGSNVLIADEGVRSAVIRLADNFVGVTVEGEQVTALAGTRLSQLVQRALEQGLGGLEFAHGIPGTVGGAAVMNAGCFGGQISEHLVSVTVIDRRGEIVERPTEDLAYRYRHSALQGAGEVVLAATFRFERRDPATTRAELARLKAERSAKQPLAQLTGGSTFRNPPGDYAARLLEAAGLKGVRCGNAEVSPRHANFIVNLGGATATEIYTLIGHMRERVRTVFGIDLKAEVVLIGEFEVVPGWQPDPAPAP